MRGYRLSRKAQAEKTKKNTRLKRMCELNKLMEKANRRSCLCIFHHFFSFCTPSFLVFFFVFSAYGCVLCTNKRLYVRASRTGSRKT